MGTSPELIDLARRLPKTELHMHIEGSLEPDMVLQMAKRNRVDLPFTSTEQLTALYNFQNLQSFLDLYYLATNVLQTEQDFFDLTWAYLNKCRTEHIVHTEIFFVRVASRSLNTGNSSGRSSMATATAAAWLPRICLAWRFARSQPTR